MTAPERKLRPLRHQKVRDVRHLFSSFILRDARVRSARAHTRGRLESAACRRMCRTARRGVATRRNKVATIGAARSRARAALFAALLFRLEISDRRLERNACGRKLECVDALHPVPVCDQTLAAQSRPL